MRLFQFNVSLSIFEMRDIDHIAMQMRKNYIELICY